MKTTFQIFIYDIAQSQLENAFKKERKKEWFR